MVNQVRTLNFLPEVFRTPTNAQFLAASLDVLTSQPDLRRVEGFIGSKYGYGIEPTDKYVAEPTKSRSDYQLDPSVVFLKKDTQTAQDFINYPGIVSALANEGAITDNNNRLFDNQFYSWDSFIDLDMAVNYSQYYWVPNGPDAVEVKTETLYLNKEYDIVQSSNGFKLANTVGLNPTLTLIRGGTYTFVVNQTTKFWIQGQPGVTGFDVQNNISTRDVYGVTNNGDEVGTVTFVVPSKTAQQQYDLPGNNMVDIVTTLQYNAINGVSTVALTDIDGVTALVGKTLMFYNNGDLSSQQYFYTISVVSGNYVLTATTPITNQQKITASTGITYTNRNFYRDSTGTIQLVPYLSAQLDTLYYQDGSDPLSVGIINLVESNATNILNVNDIIGRKTYTSPNGVTFINGLKVVFRGAVTPSSYLDKEYYVSGVGTSIQLLDVTNYLDVEDGQAGLYQTDGSILKYIPVSPQYLTIDRASRDLNAWTRSNRWFNKEVVDATITYNGVLSTITGNTASRAQRPILQFEGNLSLWDSGTEFLSFVNLFDTTTTDALSTIVGQTSYVVDGISLVDGQTVVFSADTTLSTRKVVYQVKFIHPTSPLDTPVISLVPYTTVTLDEQQVYVKDGLTQSGSAWRFKNEYWTESQKKTVTNQPPLFNIFDSNDISIGDQTYYTGSTFTGTKLFSYTPGTGTNDPVLGFPISYSSVTNIGDIEFTVNLNSDTFGYVVGSDVITKNINIGYVLQLPTQSTLIKRTGWVTAAAPSIQYQVFEFQATAGQTAFVCDIPAVAADHSPWSNAQVYYNDSILNSNQYTVTIGSSTTTITLASASVADSAITVLIHSDSVSPTAYYEIPANLENNPFNTNITSVDVGGLRNQYQSIFTNAPGVTGQLYGENNIYNLGNLNSYGTAIIQNSASLVLPGVFLRKPGLNVFDAIQFSSDEYINYKQQLVDLTTQNDFSISQTPAEMLDTVIYQLATTKNSTDAFFWSDMTFSGSPYVSNTYNFGAPTTSATFSLSDLWTPTWFEQANFRGLGIYLTRTSGNVTSTIQLIRGVDYTVSTISPSVTVNYSIQINDIITVKEYNQTYGSYCPQTPTKLGLYDSFIPGVVLNNTYTTPTWFIQGHDGSYTKLYGTYNPLTKHLSDFRDQILLEFESRVYNNLKVTGEIPLRADEVFPGQFRTTDYTRNELLSIYSTTFLNWIGKNRIDYKQQVYSLGNEFTYNYNQSSNRLDGSTIQQGYWRGVYNWLYDTCNPANAPWEMLGFTSAPSWWVSHYGAAPYTSGNTLMWADIAAGLVWNNGNSYIEPLRIRPQLLEVLPVDAAGNLVSPFISIVGNYDRLTFNREWIIGDEGPAETSYLKSSSWPFDLMRMLALTKPAKFFNLFVDRDLYKYDSQFNQYLYNDRYHLDPRTIQVYGDGVSKASYINWIVDYVDQIGVDGTAAVTETLSNIDVRLTYNLAGFSAKNYLQFLIEKSTPDTKNTSLLIPDESYAVLLYDNVPTDRLTYSSVIIQRTNVGWAVYGNSQNNKYFTVAVPKPGPAKNITVNNVTIKVSQDFYAEKTVMIPYGTTFYSVQGVAEFLSSYGQYLTNQGVLCNYMDNSILYDWYQMIREFMSWTQQGWEIGTTISLNPDAKLFSVLREGLVVQPLTIQQQNFILNQNLLPLQSQNAAIMREGESFTVEVLSEGDTVAYTNLNLSSMEHAIVFDNTTAFNDTIYNLTTGLRQTRLKLKGSKTAVWNGYIDASGFILSQDNIQDWKENTKYAKGQIVTYKAKYWAAKQLVEPAAEFFSEQWDEIDYDKIKTGMLPNPSTNAYESLYYYDSTRANLENDADLLSFSLIGYRPRQYLVDADLSDITQINVYKNIVTEKGTNLLANAFKEANLAQGQIDYKIKENWAIKNGVFGSVLNSNFVECVLDQNKLTGNPTLIGFSTSGDVANTQQTVNISDLINYERPPQSANFLPIYNGVYTDERGLPTAGYVNLDDAKFNTYSLLDLNDTYTNVSTLYRSDIVWVANYKSSWDVFTPVTLNTTLINVVNNFDNTMTLTYAAPHNLAKEDPIVVVNFDSNVNGYYTVLKVNSLTSIILSKALPTSFTKKSGQGSTFKLVSRRFAQASDIENKLVANSAFYTKKFWVDSDVDGQWAVWANGPVYQQETVPFATNVTGLGTSVAYSASIGVLASNSIDSTISRYVNSTFTQDIVIDGSPLGSKIIATGDWAFVSNPSTSKVYSFKLENGYLVQQHEINVTTSGAIAVSDDLNWLYIADSSHGIIRVYLLVSNEYVYVNQINGSTTIGFGSSIACSIDGSKLFVGSPLEDSNNITDSGAAYAYSRITQRFQVSADNQTVFTMAQTVPSNIAIVTVNDIQVSATVSGTTVTLEVVPAIGDIVDVSTGIMTLTQRVQGASVTVGSNFGTSIDTNRYGAEFIVGAPYEVSTVNNVPNVEGAAYRYTNSGQKYGVVYGNVIGTQTGSIYINGFVVAFNGTIEQIVAQINAATDTNTIATYIDTTLIISARSNAVEVINDIVDVTGQYSELAKLEIVPYTRTQVIYNPDSIESSESQNGALASTRFGYAIAMNETDSLVIGAPTANRRSETTFDYTDDLTDNDTIFDNGSTTFVDEFKSTGVVYQYDYLPADSETISNPGKYVFGQYVQITDTIDQSTAPHFGQAVAFSSNVIVASAGNWYNTSGGGRILQATVIDHTSSWYIDKKPLTMVDVNRLQDISIYDVQSNETLDFLDYIDPIQGKLLGAVSSNIDYISSTDPAIYGVGVEWTDQYVGKTWLDTSNLRMLNYNQPDITYNASNWGKAFPGSLADVYTWVSNSSDPLNYDGPGYVTNFEQYVQVTSYDRNTNSLQTVYFYWVKAFNEVPPNKTLSPITISQYVLDPLSSGISYLAGITTNVVALMNASESIQSLSSALHIGYETGNSGDNIHTSWELIGVDDEEAFLSGIPASISGNPQGLYLKYLDSFAGQDQRGEFVPERNLSPLKKYGVSFAPRQSMFVDRYNALKNFVQYANDVLIKLPIVETRNLYFLNKYATTTSASGEVYYTYDTRNYWTYANWWATGYSDSTKIIIEVATYTDLLRLVPDELITGSQDLVIVLEDGLTARVKTNNAGKAETYVYTTAAGWTRVGLENGTIQLLNTIWSEPQGWASTTWAAGVWDKTLSVETFNIVRWVNEQAFIDDLLLERNKSLILMFNVIQSDSLEQQNYLPWLNKTSLVDVSHRVRSLLPYKSYQRDNYEFLSGYLNEIKPYHVVFKDIKFTFDGIDTYPGNVTDFDLPAQYNSSTGQFETPQLVYQATYDANQYTPSNAIWSDQQYTEWFNNYGLSIQEVVILDQARGYTEPPRVTSLINTTLFPVPRETATFTSSLTAGKVSSIVINATGSGYAVTPTIQIEGSSISGSFTSSDVNTTFNTINITAHTFVTGDPVVYTVGESTVAPLFLVANEYYYVRSIDSNTIALYESLDDALDTEKYPLVDNRVKFTTQGSGENNLLTVTARAIGITSSQPVREIKTTVKFDRVTYGTKIINWEGGLAYAGSFIDPEHQTSSSLLSSSSLKASQFGVAMTITEVSPTIPRYNDLPLTNPGDGVIVTLDLSQTTLKTGQLIGQQVQISEVDWSNPTSYYLLPINDSQAQVYTDVLCRDAVSYDSFIYGVNSKVKLQEPFIVEPSIVKYANKLWRCVVSNCDFTFNYDNWVQIYSDDPALTAADRIAAFYAPSANMPGIDLSQLMTGITYPNNVLEAPFVEQDRWGNDSWDYTPWDSITNVTFDTNVTAPAFEDITPTTYDILGGLFSDGYGPEELVPGIVTDTMNLTVNTNPGSGMLYYNGFGITQFIAPIVAGKISFLNQVVNPAALFVYVDYNDISYANDQVRLLLDIDYTVNWATSEITILNTAKTLGISQATVSLYEFGGGQQLTRSNNTVDPLRTVDGHSEIYLDVTYSEITLPSTPYEITSCVMVNGQKIYYGIDYTLSLQPDNTNARIIFNQLYDVSTDYITWVFVTGTAGYSIPETQTFTDISAGTYPLEYFIGDDNPVNAIVEINGLRIYDKIFNAEYVIGNNIAYGVPVDPHDPTFDPAQVTVIINGVEVSSSALTWTLNWDTSSPPDEISGLAAEFYYPGAIGGYLDSGVGISPTSLYVVLNADYASTLFGDNIRIMYNGYSPVQDVYVFNSVSNTIEIGIDIPTGTYFSVTTFNDTTEQYLNTQFFQVASTTDEFQLVQPFTVDINRIWVSVSPSVATPGGYISKDSMQILPGNILKLTSPINPGTEPDEIIVTSMVPNASPNAMNFRINVNKYSQPTVYRQGPLTKTYLTEDMILSDSTDTIHVQDVLRLVNTTATSGVVTVTGSILVQAEQIGFTSIDIDNNTITGLSRGLNGTITNKVLYQYSQAQSILPQNVLPGQYYATDWNDDTVPDTWANALPLQIATTPAALFLQADGN